MTKPNNIDPPSPKAIIRTPCPVCEKPLAKNQYGRHLVREHSWHYHGANTPVKPHNGSCPRKFV